MKKKGFTLIELMIVASILGILAAVTIPKFQELLGKSNCQGDSKSKSCISFVNRAIKYGYEKDLQWVVKNVHRHRTRAQEALGLMKKKVAATATAVTVVETPAPVLSEGAQRRLETCRKQIMEIEQLRISCFHEQRSDCPELDSVPTCMTRGGY